jgi:hypothetical protein
MKNATFLQPNLEKTMLPNYITRGFTYLNRHRRETRLLNIDTVLRGKVIDLRKAYDKAQHPANINSPERTKAMKEVRQLIPEINFFQSNLRMISEIPQWVDLPEPSIN